tara:strand:+ start:4390 stop:5958 length:1569 start_codon:yes stop_codon:yes gene_type:complete
MTITNTSLGQSLKAIFRDGELYSESDIKVLVTKEGATTTLEYTPINITYTPNYAIIDYSIDEANQFQDGCDYLVRVYTIADKLLYTDKVYVTSVQYNTGDQNISNNDYTFTTDTESDYTIIGSGDSQSDSNDTSSTDTSNDDADNDGYGNVTRFTSGSPITHSFNMMGEFTIDESQYGTFQTASTYTEYTVKDLNARQPSDVGTQAFYSQNGLADGFNGYVKYRQGYDDRVADTFTHDMLDYPVDAGGTVRDYVIDDLYYLESQWDMSIYLDSTKTDISVGDSIYSDSQGTMLADGTTNGKKNREWFMWTDGDVVKVTAGVVTHKYNYKDQEDEKWIQFDGGPYLRKQTYDGNTVTSLEDGKAETKGMEWQGNGPTVAPAGSLVQVMDIDTAAGIVQTKLNDGWAYVNVQYNGSKIYDTFDFTKTDPFAIGEQVYTRELGFNAGRRLSSDIIAKTEPTIITGPVTLDFSYKVGETNFAYIPMFGFMTSNFNFPDRRGIILIEYDKYTGLIINKRSIYRTNNN